MSDLFFFAAFAGLALVVVWLVNGLVSLLSGDHPRDTKYVWLDMVLGELRGFASFLSQLRPVWFMVAVVTLSVLAVIIVRFIKS